MTAASTDTRSSRAPGLPLADRVVPAAPSEIDETGATLLADAQTMVALTRWKDALAALRAFSSLHGRTLEVDQLLAVAATHAGKHRLADRSIHRLRSEDEPGAETLNALAAVALHRRDFEVADLLARRAVEADAHNGRAWANLAASYAGLGWFDEAEECMRRAENLGIDDRAKLDVGRATNRWALTRTWAAATTAALAVLFGLLAVAIGLTVPFLVRDFRVSRLDDRFAGLAADAWQGEMRMRMTHALGVLVVVVTWVVVVTLA